MKGVTRADSLCCCEHPVTPSHHPVSNSDPPVSTGKSIPPAIGPARHVGAPGLVAAAIIGVQALGCAAFAVIFPLMAAQRASLSSTSHLMFSVVTAVFAAGLGLVARGLWRGLDWPRTAAAVWLVLLLPVGWALFEAGSGLAGGLTLGSAVAGLAAVTAEGRSAARP